MILSKFRHFYTKVKELILQEAGGHVRSTGACWPDVFSCYLVMSRNPCRCRLVYEKLLDTQTVHTSKHTNRKHFPLRVLVASGEAGRASRRKALLFCVYPSSNYSTAAGRV